jgi:hypothetical protein
MAEHIVPLSGNLSGQQFNSFKIAASTLIEQGNVYVSVGGYLTIPASSNAATGFRPVLALETQDNRLGANGDLSAACTWGIEIDMPNDGTHPIAQSNVGGKAYLSSAFTASATSSDGPPIDYVVEYNQPFQIAGRPVRVKF